MGIGLGFGLGPLRFYIPLVRGGRGRPRARTTYWTHPNCGIHHRTEDAANRCKVGRAVAPPPRPAAVVPRPPQPASTVDPESFPALRPVLAKAMAEMGDTYPGFARAAALVYTTGWAAPALLQRKLGVSLQTAQDLLRLMEIWGLVGEAAGAAGSRKMLLDPPPPIRV